MHTGHTGLVSSNHTLAFTQSIFPTQQALIVKLNSCHTPAPKASNGLSFCLIWRQIDLHRVPETVKLLVASDCPSPHTEPSIQLRGGHKPQQSMVRGRRSWSDNNVCVALPPTQSWLPLSLLCLLQPAATVTWCTFRTARQPVDRLAWHSQALHSQHLHQLARSRQNGGNNGGQRDSNKNACS